MIKLYQFPPCWGLPNLSPFCMKLETYLRMTGLPFEIVSVTNPRKSPKGKLPIIKDNGVIKTDSGLIIDYLKETYGDTLDEHLSPLQKAQALAWRRLMEEHLYWAALYARWIDPVNWEVVDKAVFGKASFWKRKFFPAIVRKAMQAELNGHGLGRHSKEEIYQLGVDDLKALALQLGEQPYFMGDRPSSIDACAYAFLAGLLYAPVISPLADFAKSQNNIVNYCARMKEKYYA